MTASCVESAQAEIKTLWKDMADLILRYNYINNFVSKALISCERGYL